MRLVFIVFALLWVSGFLIATYLTDPTAIAERSPMAIGVDIGQILSPLALLGVVYTFDQQRKQLETQRDAFEKQMEAMNNQSDALRDQAIALTASVEAQRLQADFLEQSAQAQSQHSRAVMDSLKVQTAQAELSQAVHQIELIERRIDAFVRYTIQSADRAQLKSGDGSMSLLGSASSLANARDNGLNFFSHALLEAMSAAESALDGESTIAWSQSDTQRCASLMRNLRGMSESVQAFVESTSQNAQDGVQFTIGQLRLKLLNRGFTSLHEKMESLLTRKSDAGR